MATITNPSANFAAEIIDNGKASGQQFSGYRFMYVFEHA